MGLDSATVHAIVAVYGSSNHLRYASAAEYAHLKKYLAERVSYVLIWILPLMMLVPYLASRVGPVPSVRSPNTVPALDQPPIAVL